MITVDIHEVTNHKDEIERRLEQSKWQRDELPAGDFEIAGVRGKVLIERKEWTDFVTSYRTGNLFNQLSRCLEQEHDVNVIIEGSKRDAKEYAGARDLELRRMITSLYFKSPVGVVETNTFEHTLQVLADGDDWLGQDPEDTTHSVRPTEKVPEEDRPRYIVEGLPKIGPTNAERLLSHFKTPYAVFHASEQELQEVEGIGPKRAERIIEALNNDHTE